MGDIENPDASLPQPRAGRFGEGAEGKGVRRVITLIAVIFFAVYLFLVDRLWAFLLIQLNHLLNWMTGA